MQRFCSRKCSGQLKRKTRTRFNCAKCGKIVWRSPWEIKKGRTVYCSKKCHDTRAAKIDRKCRCCGKAFQVHPYRLKEGNGYHCSHTCWARSRLGAKGANWSGGASFEPYPPDFNILLKELIRDRDYRTCQMCDKPESAFPIRLAVHHIDYIKEHNDPQNLIALCLKCHMRTNGKRKHWQATFSALMAQRLQATKQQEKTA